MRFLLAIFTIAPAAAWAGGDLTWESIPAPVQQTFLANLPRPQTAELSQWEEDGATIFQATLTFEGRSQSIEAAPDGTLLKREERVQPWDIPGDTLAAIDRTWPGAVIVEAEFNREGDHFSYEIELTTGGQRREVEITTAGAVLVDRPMNDEGGE